jgi:hypothetical protein
MGRPPPPVLADLASGYLDVARLLGRRTGEMHLALARSEEGDGFAPERWNTLACRSFLPINAQPRGRARSTWSRTSRIASAAIPWSLPRLLRSEREINARLRTIVDRPLVGYRIRCQGTITSGRSSTPARTS